jgi:hypothetical protein
MSKTLDYSSKWMIEWEGGDEEFHSCECIFKPEFMKLGRYNYRFTNLITGEIEQKVSGFKFAIWLSARDHENQTKRD